MKTLLLTVFIIFLLCSYSTTTLAKKARVVPCNKVQGQIIKVPFNDVMVIEFPEKPNETLPGNAHFDFKFVGNDLAVKSLAILARTNIFVYLPRERCAFKLVTSSVDSDDIIYVRYPKEELMEVKYAK